jgi:hypothetical protein
MMRGKKRPKVGYKRQKLREEKKRDNGFINPPEKS